MNRIFSAATVLVQSFTAAFFPRKCICCGEIISEDKELCALCQKQLACIDSDKLCTACGKPKKYCECRYRVFYFENCISVFENRDAAKQGYYRYKLSGRSHYARYFARRMALAVKSSYGDKKFDAIYAVPTSPLSIANRGFDHSRHLAEELSDILKIPLKKDILSCRMFRKSQHNSDFKSRTENVRGKYYIKSRISGENILLVDDIRTTGATLSECAHMLLLAGARSVSCVTVLTTISQKEIQKTKEKKR